MVFVWEALVDVRKAGPAQHAIRELATLAVPNMGPVRTASVNAARDGMESIARLVRQPNFSLFICYILFCAGTKPMYMIDH